MANAPIPNTRVISPSPTPSESSSKTKDGYFPPTTRSAAKKNRFVSPSPIDEDSSGSDRDPERRARARSRSPGLDSSNSGRRRRMSGMTALNSPPDSKVTSRKKPAQLNLPNGAPNGHLSPESANKKYWRSLSRSPSPLGLIPIHQEWRTFIHKHEIPRKILHTSIGFIALVFYYFGFQPIDIHPFLLAMLIPIFCTDVIRHKYSRVNRFYIRCLGAFMRESEVDGWNGTISYLLGAWLVLLVLPKDIGLMSILLLSWCDTAASTFGRLWGKYTPKIRQGKSLAGSLAAFVVGIATSGLFYGIITKNTPASFDEGRFAFAFRGVLELPVSWRETLGLSVGQAQISGGLALGTMSVVAGFIASASEAIDLFGWDDNVTIPILCGMGLWGFLRTFGHGMLAYLP